MQGYILYQEQNKLKWIEWIGENVRVKGLLKRGRGREVGKRIKKMILNSIYDLNINHRGYKNFI